MIHRYRVDKETHKVIPLSEWMGKYGKRSNRSHLVIDDINPYIAVTGDMEGKVITGRKAHRDFLHRNKLVEVGDEHSYMTRNGGMTDDNPNLISDSKHEENICQSLVKNLEILKSR